MNPHAQMKTKEISWSYPSSPNAVQYGFAWTGCWTVRIEEHEYVAFDDSQIISAFETLSEARAFCTEREEPYSKYSV